MQENLKAKNRHLVVIIDPHIKRDSNYHVHAGATEKGLYIKNKEGKDYEGYGDADWFCSCLRYSHEVHVNRWCWPGQSSWLDFLRPEAREYWIEQLTLDNYKGSTEILHVWNDMNEVCTCAGLDLSACANHGGWDTRAAVCVQRAGDQHAQGRRAQRVVGAPRCAQHLRPHAATRHI